MPPPVESAYHARGWSDNFRSPSPCSDLSCSGDEGDENAGRRWSGHRKTLDESLRSELDMCSREDHAAKFKHNPFTIAKMNGTGLMTKSSNMLKSMDSSWQQKSTGEGLAKKKGTPQTNTVDNSLVTGSLKSTKSTAGTRNSIISAELLIQKEKSQSLQSASKPINVPRPKLKPSAPVQFGKIPTNASSRSSEFPIVSALKKQELLPIRPRPAPRPLGKDGTLKGEVGMAPMGLGVLRMADGLDVREEEVMGEDVVMGHDGMMSGVERFPSIVANGLSPRLSPPHQGATPIRYAPNIAFEPRPSQSPLLHQDIDRATNNDPLSHTRPSTSLHPPLQAPQTFRPISSYNPPTVPKHAPGRPSEVEDDFMGYVEGEEEVGPIWNDGDGRSISQGMENQPMLYHEERIAPQRLSKPMNFNPSPPQKRSYPLSSFSKPHNRSIDIKRSYAEIARAKAKAAKEKRAVHGMEVGTVMGVVEEDLFKYERVERSGMSNRPHRNVKPRSQADFYNDDISTRSKSFSSDVEWSTIPSPKRSNASRNGSSVPTRRSALFRLPGRLFGDSPVEKDVERPRKALKSRKEGDQVKIVPMKRKVTLFTPTPMGVKKSEMEIGGRQSNDAQVMVVEGAHTIDEGYSQVHQHEALDTGAQAFGSDSATEMESRRRKAGEPTEDVDDAFQTQVPVTPLFKAVLQADYLNPCDAECQTDHQKMRYDVERTRGRYPATRAYVDESARVKIGDYLDEEGEETQGGAMRRGRFKANRLA